MSETITKPDTATKPTTFNNASPPSVATVPHEYVPWFVRVRRICLLHVDKSPPTDASVLDVFARHPRAIVGRVDPTTVESTAEVNAWLHERQRALGWPPSTSFPNGYYLFVDGEARAYDAAAPVADDMPAIVLDGVASLIGVVARWNGWLGLREEWSDVMRGSFAEREANRRVIRAFAARLAPEDAALLIHDGDDDLMRAHALLGVPMPASREEVTRRHRELTGEWHPQSLPDGPVSRAHAECVRQLDAALALIRSRSGWT
jgi:hypothetical protein